MPAQAEQQPEGDCTDRVADQQSVTTFSSILDGQPTDPQRPTLALTIARGQGISGLQTAIQIAPGRRRGLCDAVLSLQLPPVEWGKRVALGRNLGVSWEQRWHADDGYIPTIATFISSSLDYSRPNPSLSVSATFIVAKTIGSTTVYANGFIDYEKIPGASPIWNPGMVVGIKTPAEGKNAVIFDLVAERGAPLNVEVSYQASVFDDLDIGPGMALSLDKRPQLTFGVSLQKTF